MKSPFQAAVFLAVALSFCSASLVVPPTTIDSESLDIISVAGSTGDDHVSIFFSLPCQGCFSDTDNGLELNLDIPTASAECRDEPVYLNGVPVGVDHKDRSVQRHLRFPQRHTHDPVEISAIFRLTCLTNEASFLSVRILGIDGMGVSVPSALGFTVSFSRASQPEIHRLRSEPQSFIPDTAMSTWLLPEPEKKLQINSQAPAIFEHPVNELEVELRKLAALRSHLEEVKKNIHTQKKTIMSIWKSEFSKCSSMKCYFLTAVEKIPLIAHFVADHFRHHSHIGQGFLNNGTHRNCSGNHGQIVPEPKVYEDGHDEIDSTDKPTQVDNVDNQHMPSASIEDVSITLPAPAITSFQPESTEGPEMPSDHPHGPPFWTGGRPPWAHGGRPPWAKPGSSRPWGPPPWVKPGELPPWMQHHRPHSSLDSLSHHPHPLMPSLTPQQIWRIRLVGGMIGILVVLLLAACVITCVRHKARIFRDPRWRAEMLTRREEWKTKRLYRKAACKYRFRAFLRRLGATIGTSDEEEKEAMLAPQDDLVVNREISNLRAAHRFVGDMMRAEEGTSPFTVSTGTTRARAESLPSYTSAPPGYASGLEGDISVIDGFTGYTPSNTDSTPESSIVDCSPRMSFETQRTS